MVIRSGRRLIYRNSYFCRAYIKEYFLKTAHAKFIDEEVLERYYPVGGVRIEDDILVTEDGYENLTTAPRGMRRSR
jgi:Xaa-Pro dipeptidase